MVDPDPFSFAVVKAVLWYEQYERWFPEPQCMHTVALVPWISRANQAAQREVQPIPLSKKVMHPDVPLNLAFVHIGFIRCPAECNMLDIALSYRLCQAARNIAVQEYARFLLMFMFYFPC